MKVYISGAISGLSQEEYQHNFGRVEALLLDMDLEPVNPIKVAACADEDCWERYAHVSNMPKPGGGGPVKEDGTTFLHHYSCYMKYDIEAMLDCDAIALLPNYDTSRGAQTELQVAHMIGLKIWTVSDDYKEIMS